MLTARYYPMDAKLALLFIWFWTLSSRNYPIEHISNSPHVRMADELIASDPLPKGNSYMISFKRFQEIPLYEEKFAPV